MKDAHGETCCGGDREHAPDCMTQCAYCGREAWTGNAGTVPPAVDDDGWAELARDHERGCEWVVTRAHTRK